MNHNNTFNSLKHNRKTWEITINISLGHIKFHEITEKPKQHWTFSIQIKMTTTTTTTRIRKTMTKTMILNGSGRITMSVLNRTIRVSFRFLGPSSSPPPPPPSPLACAFWIFAQNGKKRKARRRRSHQNETIQWTRLLKSRMMNSNIVSESHCMCMCLYVCVWIGKKLTVVGRMAVTLNWMLKPHRAFHVSHLSPLKHLSIGLVGARCRKQKVVSNLELR